MKHVYLAGPFFSNEQVARLKQVERSLAENPQPLKSAQHTYEINQ
ncbi:hypothetical protein [Enterococcus casseliflavus]|jgi:nucleoside 2-deoxyribosyltransferase